MPWLMVKEVLVMAVQSTNCYQNFREKDGLWNLERVWIVVDFFRSLQNENEHDDDDDDDDA